MSSRLSSLGNNSAFSDMFFCRSGRQARQDMPGPEGNFGFKKSRNKFVMLMTTRSGAENLWLFA